MKKIVFLKQDADCHHSKTTCPSINIEPELRQKDHEPNGGQIHHEEAEGEGPHPSGGSL